jgi:DNA-binding response OmpR family regulator
MPKKRVLVVEDQFEIGLDIHSVLSDAGFDVVGPMMTIEDATAAVENGAIDAAVLDANLNGRNVGPLAAKLKELEIPFVVVSGYTAPCLPLEVIGAPLITKPYQAAALVDAVARLWGAPIPRAERPR